MIFKTSLNELYLTQKLYLNVGNPNVYDLLNDINSKLSGYLTCTYDNIKNKITYTRIYAQTSNYHTMYMNAVNSGCFFELNNNVDISISLTGTECTNPININSIRA